MHPFQGKYEFDRTNSFAILGICYDIEKMGEMTKLNIYQKQEQIKKLIRPCQARKFQTIRSALQEIPWEKLPISGKKKDTCIQYRYK